MDWSEINIEHIAKHVIDEAFTDQVLQSLPVIAASPDSSQRFVDALMANISSSKERSEEIVSKAMRALEGLAERSEEAALTFMKSLRPIADELKTHDTYDAIGLWLDRDANK